MVPELVKSLIMGIGKLQNNEPDNEDGWPGTLHRPAVARFSYNIYIVSLLAIQFYYLYSFAICF